MVARGLRIGVSWTPHGEISTGVTAAVSALPGLAGGAVAASPVLAGGRGGGWQVTRVGR